MNFYAHKRLDENGNEVLQTTEAHCRNTAAYASNCLKSVNLSHAGYLSGLLHDAGKFKTEFNDYLLKGECEKGQVNHSFAGCRMLMEHFHGECSENYDDASCELMAYAVAAHHGLFDCVNEKRESGFLHRMTKENILYEESRDNFLKFCAGWPELEAEFNAASEELSAVFELAYDLSEKNSDDLQIEFMFYIGLLTRLLLSAVIEGDRRDTAEFMDAVCYPDDIKDYPEFWKKHLNHAEEKISLFKADTPIQCARRKISDMCRNFAENPSGVYKLNVPTGGGKTLSSLRYALAHASKWGKKRIIFVTPLLSILEQNAEVIRNYIDDDRIILEHHSNVINSYDNGDELDNRELAVDSWNAPVIITTLVQLLNTFFSGKTGSIRRFQALCNSVVIIDEVQTVPNNMLSLFNLTVNFLSQICGTAFVLCSATQPCFDKAVHPLIFSPSGNIVPYSEKLWAPFKRTDIENAGAKRLDEIPDFIRDIFQDSNSLLVICNKKSEAEFIYEQLAPEFKNCFHLSASMCVAHRRDTIAKIKSVLNSEKLICISTQLIEAGVDISFETVVRLTTGMDSVVQAAGRCNRNGEKNEPSPVYIVQCSDENLGRLKEIQRAKNASLALLESFKNNPSAYNNDLSSDNAIKKYYEKLYAEMYAESRDFQNFAVKGAGKSILDLLSGNTGLADQDLPFHDKYSLNQAFKLAGSLFHVFDDDTVDAVVPYGKGARLIAELISNPNPDPGWLVKWSQQIKPYTVSLYDYQVEKFADMLYSKNGILILREEAYNSETGLKLSKESIFWEV